MEENIVAPQQPNQPTSPTPQQPSVAMQIQQLLVQQQQLQQQYNQIVAFLKENPNQTPEKIQEIKTQLDKINAAYVQGQQQLQALGYTTVQVNKSVTVKEGAKNNFSFKKLAIGCGFLLIFILIGFGVTLFFLKQNPNALTSVGINASTAKSLLTMFAGLLVGGIGLVGIGFLFTNIYRLITIKNQSKIRYIFSLLLAVGMLGIAVGLAVFIFGQINQIKTETIANPDQLVLPYLIIKGEAAEGTEKLYTGQIPLIAPSEFAYTLQPQALLTYASKHLGEIDIQTLTLNCGNPQKQVLTHQSNNTFAGRCFYDRKGEYTVTLEVKYRNKLTADLLSTTFNVGTLTFKSEMQIFQTNSQSNKKPQQLFATQNAIILWKAPIKITVDATSVFRDFNLGTYDVSRDMDNDNVYDRENLSTFDYTYKLPKVYYPTVKFPWLSDYSYTFPVRVEQSDVPICEINIIPFEKTKYKIQTSFLDGSISNVSSYSYTILDSASKKVIDTIKKDTRDIDYTFPERGSYLIILDFITIDGKRGNCESEPLQLAQETIEATYILRQKFPEDIHFTTIPETTISGNTILVSKIPQTIQIDLTAVVPDTISTQKNIFVDGKIILNQGTLYQFEINQEKTYEVVIELEDTDRDIKREIPLSFVVKKPDIIGELTLLAEKGEGKKPIGFTPLTVTLDASKTTLNVPDDEIVYFSWDFGDGETKKNLSNGVTSHTYVYDKVNQNGVYTPKVTIQTRKGLTSTFTAKEQIIVKQQLTQAKISSPSNPTQIARVGDIVSFVAEISEWLPERMTRDFGDDSEIIQCKNRGCVEVTHMYALPSKDKSNGVYIVGLTLEFEKTDPIEVTMQMKIN